MKQYENAESINENGITYITSIDINVKHYSSVYLFALYYRQRGDVWRRLKNGSIEICDEKQNHKE